MKIMMMHKHSENTERGVMPPPELFERMGALIGGAVQSGKLLDGDGLGKTIHRVRVGFANGVCTVVHGPFTTGHNELPAAFTKVTVKTRDEAIAIAKEIGAAVGGDIDLEVGKLTEEWDLTGAAPPPGAPERYLIQQKATASTEKGGVADLTAVHERLKKSGTFLSAASLLPSREARRLQFQKKKNRVVIDGPFTESKEMIGGFVVMEMESMEAAVAYATEYAEILLLGQDFLELDVRHVR